MSNLHKQVPKRLRSLVMDHARQHGWDERGSFVGASKFLDDHDLTMLPASMPCAPPKGMNIEFWLTPTQRAVHKQRQRDLGPKRSARELQIEITQREQKSLASLGELGLLVGFPASPEIIANRKEQEFKKKLRSARNHLIRDKAPAFRRPLPWSNK